MRFTLFPMLLMSILLHSQNNNIIIGGDFINNLFVEKNYSKAYRNFDEIIKKEISENILEQTIQQLKSQIGNFKNILEINNIDDVYYFYSEFENQKLDIILTFNGNNKIIGFFFSPHKEFVKQNRKGEDLNILSDNIQLEGTLLIPNEEKLKKIVIFVQGSGPQDRDATLLENKPFKDIAESLYEVGIVSYRFDKKTFSNPQSFNINSTIDDEYTKDVINVINFIKNDNRFKGYEIILLGHSLGGYLLPKIYNKTKQVSKLICLAGNSRPLEQLIIEQLEYLYEIAPREELQMELAKVKEQVEYLNSQEFNEQSPKEKLPFNMSAYYWKSLLDYNLIKETENIKIPFMILQGERDYQVSMKDFEFWKKVLNNNKKALFISYPKLNHLFMIGEGISAPKEYSIKGNVDTNVIEDIKNFIIKN
jgi:uncharacterized protein